jgi:hypothetical protein
LLKKFNLTEKNLWTHKEVVGWKDCHKWFVDNPKEWEKFKALVGTKLRGEEPMLSKKDSEEVIKYLGKAWNLAKTEEEKNHIHELANAVRKVSEVK